MASSTDMRHSPRQDSKAAPAKLHSRSGNAAAASVVPSTSLKQPLTTDSPVRLVAGTVGEFKDRRRRRRVAVPPMYSSVTVRVLSRQGPPLEGHVLDLSETGMAVELDEQIGIGQPVAVEFTVAGLGRQRQDQWPAYAAAAEIVRIDDLADFPAGPYRTALRFVRIATMVQAQIARYVVMQPAQVS